MGRVGNFKASAEDVSALVKLFIIQLTKGCGSETCISASCHTYRTRTADRPYRPWTELSARALAFHLASEPNAVDLLCHDVDGNALLKVSSNDLGSDGNHANRVADKAPVDEKSMSQALFDTDAVIDCINNRSTLPASDQKYLQNLQEYDQNLDRCYIQLIEIDNDEGGYLIVDTILSSLYLLYRHVASQEWYTTSGIRSRRHIIFCMGDYTIMHMATKVAQFLNRLHLDETPKASAIQRLLVRAFQVGSAGNGLRPRYDGLQSSGAVLHAEKEAQIPDDLVMNSLSQHLLLFEIITCVFLKHWDGRADVVDESTADVALTAMDWLETHFGPLYQHCLHLHSFLTSRLNLVNILRQADETHHEPRLLKHTWLFSAKQQAAMFRARRLLKMERAIDATSLVHKLLPTAINVEVRHLVENHLFPALSARFGIQASRFRALDDVCDALWKRDVSQLMLPLHVKLNGVQDIGQDAGGVAQEFLQLCWIQAMDEDLGLFRIDQETKMAWFSPHCFEHPYRYELLGALFALSLHNGFTLPVTFPLALYKKLLGMSVNSIADIEDGWPDIARGLKKLCDWDEADGTVEDVFGLTFNIAVEYPIQGTKIYDMARPNTTPHHPTTALHDATAVTSANRMDYITLYVEYLTSISIHRPLTLFTTGFHSVIPTSQLTCLAPSTLRTLIEGDPAGSDFCVDRLRKHTKYQSGYDDASPAIESFWKVVKSWNAEMKMKFLMFVTASKRLPVMGEKGVEFEIVQAPLHFSPPAVVESTTSAADETTDSRHPSEPNDLIEESPTTSLDIDSAASPPQITPIEAITSTIAARQRKATLMKHAPLPTSNTCFTRLNLPDYGDEDVLRVKLEMAVELGWIGFGLA